MSGNPYFYFIEHRPSPFEALQALREREFLAGRYEPGFGKSTGTYMFQLEFPPNDTSPAPGPRHDSIDAAVHDGYDEGTCSILDIQRISDEPDFLAASPMMHRWPRGRSDRTPRGG